MAKSLVITTQQENNYFFPFISHSNITGNNINIIHIGKKKHLKSRVNRVINKI